MSGFLGLNGTGKSNILDSICFVLGITNLTHIRAGITKATVSITFDNRDKKHGPIGYHNCDEIVIRRQIIVNGRNSYTINGSTATNAKVSDFFRSVGLNVNNPHFLIMQGRITKVLNMKPHEILGMIEEAAGTKLYEAKRTLALNTIHKKQSKVDEIEKVFRKTSRPCIVLNSHCFQLMAEDILPQLEKLQRDKQNFLEYNNCDREIERQERKLTAFTYHMSLVSFVQSSFLCCYFLLLSIPSPLLLPEVLLVLHLLCCIIQVNSEQCEQLALNKAEEIKSLGSELEETEALLEVQQSDLTRVEEAKKRVEASVLHILLKV
ncbi:unnamed protein product [Heligmosomoides polygyrus]|uniref:RecF/RecN/SMC N-terminal domain-containing protein n=1 Tax=Heligmosomoides polygyrus TaxID=6339 RepID=A0A3P8HW20_HELPZ|nr:unnamed protein product [Heligmosomoides polygyrus]